MCNLEVWEDTCEKPTENLTYPCPLCIRIAAGWELNNQGLYCSLSLVRQSPWISLLTVLFGTREKQHGFCGHLERGCNPISTAYTIWGNFLRPLCPQDGVNEIMQVGFWYSYLSSLIYSQGCLKLYAWFSSVGKSTDSEHLFLNGQMHVAKTKY